MLLPWQAGSGSRDALAVEKLNYICWERHNDPAIIGPSEDKHDVKVEFDFITDSAGAFAKLAAGVWRSFDVISPIGRPAVFRQDGAGLGRTSISSTVLWRDDAPWRCVSIPPWPSAVRCSPLFYRNTGAVVADLTLAQKGLLDGSMKTFLSQTVDGERHRICFHRSQ